MSSSSSSLPEPSVLSAKRRINSVLGDLELTLSRGKRREAKRIRHDIHAPHSTACFLDRLASFARSDFFEIESTSLSPVTFALHGWHLDGGRQLVCRLCDGVVYPVTLRGSPDKQEAVVKRYCEMARRMHEDHCLWRTPCDLSVLNYPHLAPSQVWQCVQALQDTASEDVRSLCVDTSALLMNEAQQTKLVRLQFGESADVAKTMKDLALALFGWTLEHSETKQAYLQCSFCSHRVGIWSRQDTAFHPEQHHSWWCFYVASRANVALKEPNLEPERLATLPWWRYGLEVLTEAKQVDTKSQVPEHLKDFPSATAVASLLQVRSILDPIEAKVQAIMKDYT
ncbi:Nuclear-interacting partner of ALK [Sorochytrium milnesiophthora]